MNHGKSAYDRQTRSSYHGATQQYGTYADLENEMNYMKSQGNHLDNYGGEREIQGFGQQLFSGQSGGEIIGDNVNFHYSHESHRLQSRTEMVFPSKPTTVGNKPYTTNNRMMQNISGNSDPNILPLPVRSLGPASNSTDPLNYSPQNSPRTPRLGNFNIGGGAIAVTSALGSTLPSHGPLNPYIYPGQLAQALGQGQQQSSSQTDPRLLAERDLNIASRPYTSTAHSNVATVQRSAYGNVSSLVGSGNSVGLVNQGYPANTKHNNQANTAGQYTASLPSPRTTSYMPFGSLNSSTTRGLGDFGEFSVGAGSDFGGSDGLSQHSTDEQASQGEQSTVDYYFKGDYTSTMLDPIHISREQNMDNIESTLESNIDSDVSIYGYGNPFSYLPKPWESL